MKEDPVVLVGISCKPKMENLFLAELEIDDYFSENPILGISDVEDLKSCLSMIRELRVKFKKSMFEVKSNMGEDKLFAMCTFCKELLDQASDYITQANERVKVLREGEAKKADDLAEKIRLAEFAEMQKLEDKADEREKKADDLAEKIRLAEISRADGREKMADDLVEKIRLAEITRAEKLWKEDPQELHYSDWPPNIISLQQLSQHLPSPPISFSLSHLSPCPPFLPSVGFMLARHFPKLRRD